MRKAQVIALVILALFALLVCYLALRTRQPPRLPADEIHTSVMGADQCLGCHGPGGMSPRSKDHPLGRDCLRCHGLQPSVVSLCPTLGRRLAYAPWAIPYSR